VNFKKLLKRVLFYCAVAMIIFIILAPFYWLFISSVTSVSELTSIPPHWIPRSFTLKNYIYLIRGGEKKTITFAYGLRNSFIVASCTTMLCLFLGSLAAYPLARLNFRGKGIIFSSVIFLRMIPTVSLIIPLYLMLDRLGLVNTKTGLITLYLSFGLTLVIWLLKNYFETIPKSIEDAAIIDGCNRLGVLYRIILPLSLPGLGAASILIFLSCWNSFFFAVVFTSTIVSKTVPVAITEFSTRYRIDYSMICASSVIAIIPPVVMVLLFGKLMIKGLVEGAVKA